MEARHADVEARVLEVMGLVFERDIDATERPTRADEEVWDSLKHIELIFALEGELGLRFDEDEMAGLDSFDSIVNSAVRHREG
jgi:acyl carrier protein